MRPLPVYIPERENPQSCDSLPDRCVECELHTTLCRGCVESGKRDERSPHFCLQGNCASGCGVCGGAKAAVVPALCCKSPAKLAMWPELPKWRDPSYRPLWWQGWHTVEPLPLTQKGISYSQHASSLDDPYPEGTESWAISLRHLRGKRGWVTDDVHDFLQLPKSVKIISLTSMQDDLLENMWERGVLGGDEFERRGISYVMPLMFSNYTAYGQMMNAFMAIRSLEATVAGQCHFVPLNWASGLLGDHLVLEAVSKVKNGILNAQFTRSNKENWRVKLQEIVRWHHVLPLDVSLFIIGISRGGHIVTIRQMCQGREVYFLSSTPFIAGTRGRAYSEQGKEEKTDEADRSKLVQQNQRNFQYLCSEYEPPPLRKDQKTWRDALEKQAPQPPRIWSL